MKQGNRNNSTPDFTQNVLANYLGQAWSAAASVLFLPVFFVELGPKAWAVVGFVGLMQAWMGVLDLGLSMSLGRQIARRNWRGHERDATLDLVKTAEWTLWPATGLAILIVWAVADKLAVSWLHSDPLQADSYALAIRLLFVTVACRFLESAYRGCLIGLDLQVRSNMLAAFGATVRNLGAALLLWLTDVHIIGFAVWQLLSSLLVLVLVHRSVHQAIPPGLRRPRFSRTAWTELKSVALPASIAAGLGLLLLQMDKLVISAIALHAEQLGEYYFLSTAAAAIGLLIGPAVQACFPKIVRTLSTGDVDRAATQIRVAWRIALYLTCLGGTPFLLLPSQLLDIWAGQRSVTPGSPTLLAVLAVGASAVALSMFAERALFAARRFGVLIGSLLTANFLMAALLYLAIHEGKNLTAIAAASSGTLALYLLLAVPIQLWAVFGGTFVKVMFREAVTTVFFGGLGATITFMACFLTDAPESSLFRVFIVVMGTGMTLYLGGRLSSRSASLTRAPD